MTKLKTDVELVTEYSEKYGATYEAAKNLYIDAPIQTLVDLRDLLDEICGVILTEHSCNLLGEDLADKISKISHEKLFRSEITELMRSVKDAGNKAAHRKDYKLSFDELSELALVTLKSFCNLIQQILFSELGKFSDYIFSDKIESPIKDWAYQALVHDNTEAKFELGLALFEKHKEASFESDSCDYKENKLLDRSIGFIEEAAEERHVNAMFEYGCIIFKGFRREANEDLALSYISSSAFSGNIGAKAYFSKLVLLDKNSQKIVDEENVELAIEFAFSAAEGGNGQAQFVLSKIFKVGKYIKKDLEKADYWLGRSVASGYSEGLFELSQIQLKIPEKKRDKGFNKQIMEQLKQAAALGHKEAHILFINQFSKNGGVEGTFELFEEYLEFYPDDNKVRLWYAEYTFDKSSLNLELKSKALSILIAIAQSYNVSGANLRKVNQLSPKWLREFEREQIILGNRLSKDTLAIFPYFKPNGTPYQDPLVVGKNILLMTEKPECFYKYFYMPLNKR